MGKALRASLMHGKRLRGASTISQQLVKNLFLTSERSFERKFWEALITIKLEAHVSKERILELYMNGIDWGRGLIGIRAAAQFYFGRSPEDLSIKQAVFLAAIIPNPARFSRNPKSHFVQTRMMMALEALYRARIISLEEYSVAVGEEL
jgi:monofunctional biosynthetic peptidoglycan transglycosylase